MADEKRISPYFFTVEIDGIETARFQKCDGLEAETRVCEIEEGGGGVRKFPASARFPNIVLEKGVTENNALFAWFKETVMEDKQTERKNGSVVLKDAQGGELKRWNFFRAFPCRWTGPKLEGNMGSEYALERLEIAHEGLMLDGN